MEKAINCADCAFMERNEENQNDSWCSWYGSKRKFTAMFTICRGAKRISQEESNIRALGGIENIRKILEKKGEDPLTSQEGNGLNEEVKIKTEAKTQRNNAKKKVKAKTKKKTRKKRTRRTKVAKIPTGPTGLPGGKQ